MHSFYRFDGQLLRLEIACLKLAMYYESLDGGGVVGFWNSLISKKKIAHYSLSLKCMLIL